MRISSFGVRARLMLGGIAILPVVAGGAAVHAQEGTAHLGTLTLHGKQDTYFEQSNVTALKSDVEDSATPFVVTTANGDLIEDVQASHIKDVFDYTVGVNQSGYSADSFVIRGFDIDLNNIKVDGMSGLTTRFGSPSTANIERVEVLKGAASVLYGNMETGGMVNLVTKQPEQEFSATLTTEVETFVSDVSGFGDDNGVTTTLDVTGALAGREDLSYRLIATGSTVDSFRKGINHKEAYLYASVLWDIDDVSQLTLGLEAGKQTGDADYGLAALNNDINRIASIDTVYQNKDDFDNDTGYALTAQYQRDLASGGALHLNWRSNWHEDARELFENRKVNDAAGTLARRYRD